MNLFLSLTGVAVLIGLSGILAGSETGMYRLSRFWLRLGMEQKKPFHRILSSVVQDAHGLVLSLLMGNNLANYFATSLATYLFYTRLEKAALAELYSTAVLTPVLFLFVDILPKNLFYCRADSFLVTLSPLIWVVYHLFNRTGIIALLKGFSGRLNRFFHTAIDTPQAVDLTQQEQIQQIFHETREEGLLSDTQKTMMDRLIRTPSLPVASVMTPLSKVRMIELHTPADQVYAHLAEESFSRLPVYEQSPQNLRGYLEIYDVLSVYPNLKTLDAFVKPLMKIPASCSVISALHQMQKQKQFIALVVSESAPGPSQEIIGLVTDRDLVEEFTGALP